MFYEFPIIETIDDVLPHLEGRKEFVVADRGDHTIINYAVAFADTFGPVTSVGDAIRRECRGLIFRKSDGRIIRRPFHKFFNVGEKEETQPDVIAAVLDDTSSLEKLDGSMIAPFEVFPGEIRWGTKMGDTDVAKMVLPFLHDHPRYVEFAHEWVMAGFTPIFEFCSRAQRIVIDYPETRLVLTAMRNMRTGQYHSYPSMIDAANKYGIDYVRELSFDLFARDVEGVVLRTFHGHMLKMKCESYVRIHKAKDKISVEKNAVAAIINNEIDDLLPELAQEDRDRVNRLSEEVHHFLTQRALKLADDVDSDVRMFKDRKTYALEAQRPQWHKAAVFKLWDTEPYDLDSPYRYLYDQLVKSLGKEVNYEDFKRVWEFNSTFKELNDV